MLELNPNAWRKPRKEANPIGKVKSFVATRLGNRTWPRSWTGFGGSLRRGQRFALRRTPGH